MAYANFSYSIETGEITPYNDCITVVDYGCNVNIYAKTTTSRLLISTLHKYNGVFDPKHLKIADENTSVVLDNLKLLNKALEILSNNTNFYEQICEGNNEW